MKAPLQSQQKQPKESQKEHLPNEQLLRRQQLYQTIAAIPHGKVASYSQLAALAG